MATLKSSARKTVTILGTGDFGRALGARLIKNDFLVYYGSREPNKRDLGKLDHTLLHAPILSVSQSIRESEIIFLCVNMEAHHSLRQFQHLLAGKIVVDVSNHPEKPEKISNAEKLCGVLPGARLVKAFNTVSAYSLESDVSGDNRLVYVCSEDMDAKEQIKDICWDIGLVAVDCGGILASRKLEAMPHELLQSWWAPTVVMTLFLIWWIFYTILRYYVLRESPYTWERFATNALNKSFACLSVTLLALCYLPGCIAAYAQLFNGTKYKRFPAWLDHWLKMRKQLGLYALLYAMMHMIMSCVLIAPAYYSDWFHTQTQTINLTETGEVSINIDSRMTWLGEVCTLTGVLATANMAVVGITSLPSVGAALNWREWKFAQSTLGWLCLLLSIAHTTIKGAGSSWQDKGFDEIAQTMSFVSMIIPYLTVLLQVILLVPCVYSHLWDIRRGHERGSSDGSSSPDTASYCLELDGQPGTTSSSPLDNGVVTVTPNGHVNEGFIVEKL